MNETKPHILIIDDDTKILKLLKIFFLQNNFFVSTATNITETYKLLKEQNFDLIILDVMLPQITGIEFAKMLRSEGNTLPILMLTALHEPSERVAGLEAGANDYVTKPFEPKELLLRVKNLININKNFFSYEKIFYLGDDYYDQDKKEFFKNNQPVHLSSTEDKLLNILLNNKNNILSRENLTTQMNFVSDRSIDVQITRLRQKIEQYPQFPKYLKTIRNKGYGIFL